MNEDKNPSKNDQRSVVYLDLEDDITEIIGKLSGSEKTTVALVVPKRSNVFQSIVNLKLINKSAKESSKNLQLITDDHRVSTFANRLGIPNAHNLTTEASVKETDVLDELPSNVINAQEQSQNISPEGSKIEDAKEIALSSSSEDDTDNKTKALKVPDFNKFKKRLIIGFFGLVVILIGIWLFMARAPKANIFIDGQTENRLTEFDFSIDTSANELDTENSILPVASQEISKTLSDNFTATGKKDVGKKASGTLTITNCASSDTINIPIGTKFTASNGLVYTNPQAVSVPGSTASAPTFTCNKDGKATTTVNAEKSGETYNINPTTYTVEGYDSGNVSATGGNMSGGTTETVTVISQKDIDNTLKGLLDKDKESVEAELREKFNSSQYILEESFTQKVTEISSDPAVGAEANEGRIVVKVTYFQLAVSRGDMAVIVSKHAEGTDSSAAGLAVVDTRLDSAEVKLIKDTDGEKYHFRGNVVLGPNIDLEQLAGDIAGKGYSEAIKQIESLPNVTHADIKLSPFWVSSLPKDTSKTNITINLPK